MENEKSSRLSQRIMKNLLALILIPLKYNLISLKLLSNSPPSFKVAKSSINLKVFVYLLALHMSVFTSISIQFFLYIFSDYNKQNCFQKVLLGLIP